MSLYKETLMSHFKEPKHKYSMDNPLMIQEGYNPSCGDDLTIFLGDNNKLSYIGNGCAISMASADIMCSVLSMDIKKEVIENFILSIKGEKQFNFTEGYEILNIFEEMQNYPARQGCALLPWNTLKKLVGMNF